jgi:hypothetical protein
MGRMWPSSTCTGCPTGHQRSTSSALQAPAAVPRPAAVRAGCTGSLPRRASTNASTAGRPTRWLTPRHFSPGRWAFHASASNSTLHPTFQLKMASGTRMTSRRRDRRVEARGLVPNARCTAAAAMIAVPAVVVAMSAGSRGSPPSRKPPTATNEARDARSPMRSTPAAWRRACARVADGSAVTRSRKRSSSGLSSAIDPPPYPVAQRFLRTMGPGLHRRNGRARGGSGLFQGQTVQTDELEGVALAGRQRGELLGEGGRDQPRPEDRRRIGGPGGRVGGKFPALSPGAPNVVDREPPRSRTATSTR